MPEHQVAAIILAAGGSSRFGRPKLLVDWQGKPLVAHVADQVLTSPARPVIAVTGAFAGQVRQALAERPVQVAHNPDWEQGQSTSVRVGLAGLPENAAAAVFVLADQPGVTPGLIAALVDVFGRTGAPIVQPRLGDRPGNPVLFARALFGDLGQLVGDQGGRPVIERYRDRVVVVPVSDPALFRDIDTQADYASYGAR